MNSPGPLMRDSSIGFDFEISPTTSSSFPDTPLSNTQVALRLRDPCHMTAALGEQAKSCTSISDSIFNSPHDKYTDWSDTCSLFHPGYTPLRPDNFQICPSATTPHSKKEKSAVPLKHLFREYPKNLVDCGLRRKSGFLAFQGF